MAKSKLKQENEDIQFNIFSSRDLENIFFTLNNEQMLSLGFNVDSTNSIRITRDYLGTIENELNKGNAKFVLSLLENIKNIVTSQGDEGLVLEYEIIEAKALQKIEKVKDAREKYKSIAERYLMDPRALLLLAEIYLNNEDFDKNDELLKQAEQIDATH